MKTLLTGANGLVGSTIIADVYIRGRRHVDLTSREQTLGYFIQHKPDAVIHTAARVGGLGANMKHNAEFFDENMRINLNVLEASRLTGVKKVVSFLSTCVFPHNIDYPITEDKLHAGEPHPSNYGYAHAKRMLEVQSRAISEQYGLNYICVIPTNIYGPYDNFNLESSHVVPGLIHKCYIAKRDNTDLVVWGTGNPLREFIFSQNVGSLTQRILDEYEGTDPIILSTSEEISIRELVETIAKVMDYRGKIIFDSTKPDGQYRKPTSNRKLMSFLPEYKFTSLEDGINRTVRWFNSNYESCIK